MLWFLIVLDEAHLSYINLLLVNASTNLQHAAANYYPVLWGFSKQAFVAKSSK